MIKAWNIASAENIKKTLAKFMKTNKVSDFSLDELSSPHKLSKERSALMKRFWADNLWAKKTFSKNIEYAWRKVKEEQEMFYVMDVTPKTFKRRFLKWCKEQGVDTSELDFDAHKYYPHRPEKNETKEMFEALQKINRYTPKYIDSCSGDESKKLANTLFLALLKFGKHLKSLENSQYMTTETKAVMMATRRFVHSQLFDTTSMLGYPNPKVLDAQEVQQIYSTVLSLLMDHHENILLRNLNDFMNESYEYLDKSWNGGGIALAPDAHLF